MRFTCGKIGCRILAVAILERVRRIVRWSFADLSLFRPEAVMTESKKNVSTSDDEAGLANMSLNSSRRPASSSENKPDDTSAVRHSEPVPAPSTKVPDQQMPKG
jgi:hypothetical protein